MHFAIYNKNNLEMNKYKPYIYSLLKFMAEHGYTAKPLPKLVFHKKKQNEEIFIKTGYYDPSNKEVHLYTEGRHIKDILRSLAHELIHHKQNMDGRLTEDAYDGDTIYNDKKLQELEKEAYLKGNISFRTWTELVKNGTLKI